MWTGHFVSLINTLYPHRKWYVDSVIIIRWVFGEHGVRQGRMIGGSNIWWLCLWGFPSWPLGMHLPRTLVAMIPPLSQWYWRLRCIFIFLSRFHADTILRWIHCFVRCWTKQKWHSFFSLPLIFFPKPNHHNNDNNQCPNHHYRASLRVCFFHRGKIVPSYIGSYWFLIGRLFPSFVALIGLFYI